MPSSSSTTTLPSSSPSPGITFSSSAPSFTSLPSPSPLVSSSSSLSSSSSFPPSASQVSASSLTGRSSMSYSQKQRNKLEDFFILSSSLSREEEAGQISRLSNEIGLTKDQIRGWLRNRRKRGSYKGKTYHRVEHVLVLEWIYNHHSKYPSRRLKKKLSFELGMTYSQIKIWFQSRRQRGKPVILTRDIVEDPFSDKQWSQVMERVQRMIAKEIEEEGAVTPMQTTPVPPHGVMPTSHSNNNSLASVRGSVAPLVSHPTPSLVGLPSPNDMSKSGGATVFSSSPSANTTSSSMPSVAPLPSISQIFPSLTPVSDIFYFTPTQDQTVRFHPQSSYSLPQPGPHSQKTDLKGAKPGQMRTSSQSEFQFQFQFQPQSASTTPLAPQQQVSPQSQTTLKSEFQFQFQPRSQSPSSSSSPSPSPSTPSPSLSSQSTSPSLSRSPSQAPSQPLPQQSPSLFAMQSCSPTKSPIQTNSTLSLPQINAPQTSNFPSSQLPPLPLTSFLFANNDPQQPAKPSFLLAKDSVHH